MGPPAAGPGGGDPYVCRGRVGLGLGCVGGGVGGGGAPPPRVFRPPGGKGGGAGGGISGIDGAVLSTWGEENSTTLRYKHNTVNIH